MDETFHLIHLIRSVDLFTLRLFLTIVQEGQLGRAAAHENITASAATKRIQDLEEIVGVQLFERNSRGVVPTAAGRVLTRYIRQIFATLEDVRRDLGEFTQGVRGTIRVCAVGSAISRFLAQEIAEFARDFPMVDIDLSEAVNSEVIRAVAAGEVDVGVFVRGKGPFDDEIDIRTYRIDRLVAVVPRSHPLAMREHLTVSELLEDNFIGISPSTTLMENVRGAATQAGLQFKPKYMVNSVYAANALVRASQGVTIQPEHMLSVADLEWVSVVPLAEPWARPELLVGTKRGRVHSAATRNFIAHLTQLVA